MTLNQEVAGKRIGPLIKDYTWQDVALYGLSVGAGFSDLEYCYEKHLKTLPTFSMAAIFDLFWQVAVAAELDLGGVLHGEQALRFHHPIPTDGQLITHARIARLLDKGKDKGALVVAESETRHRDGPPLFSGTTTIFSRRDGGFGGPNTPPATVSIPDPPPHHRIPDRPAENQPLLYRLTGDLFALHVDPDFARRAGFGRPIMHGLCTMGFACRALIRALAPGRPDRVRQLRCRFTAPLYPGTPIETHIWETGPGRAKWRVTIPETGQVVIDNGLVEIGAPPAADPIPADRGETGPSPEPPHPSVRERE